MHGFPLKFLQLYPLLEAQLSIGVSIVPDQSVTGVTTFEHLSEKTRDNRRFGDKISEKSRFSGTNGDIGQILSPQTRFSGHEILVDT